ncbi:MAG TPA: ATP-binding protein [Pirellulales bacterium]
MRFRRLRDVFRSLRFRLTLWNTAVVLLTVVCTLMGVREALRFALRHEIDQLLREDALEVELAVEQMYHSINNEAFSAEMTRKVAAHIERGMFVELLDENDKVLWCSENTPSEQLFKSDLRDGTMTIAGQRYRVVQSHLEKPGLPTFTVRVGSSMASADEDIAKVTQVMTIVALLIMLIAPLGGFWLSGRATHPLAQIIHTADRLRPRRMEERLPMRGTGDELDQLSATINRFLDLIAEYLDRNREFVANAAHELRSPLAAIQSSVEVALNSDRTIDEYKDLLSDIVDECSSLGKLVNQLLLLAESDAGSMQIDTKAVALDRLTKHSVDMFQGAAEERGVDLHFGRFESLPVRGDAQRLQQVVNNLIDNAVKFTQSGGSVTVDLSHDRDRARAIVQVRDTGMGIPSDDLPHVFERFYRGDKSRQRENQPGGTGLGLSICQSIVQAHGGKMEIQSTLGKGTTATVYLPAAPQDATQERLAPFAIGPA